MHLSVLDDGRAGAVPCAVPHPGQAALKHPPRGAAGRVAASRHSSTHGHTNAPLWRRWRNGGGRVSSTAAAPRPGRPLAAKGRTQPRPTAWQRCRVRHPPNGHRRTSKQLRAPRGRGRAPRVAPKPPWAIPPCDRGLTVRGPSWRYARCRSRRRLGTGGGVPLSPCGTRRPSRLAAR